MDLGKKLKKYRETKNMYQKYIAELLGVEPGTVSKYESNQLEPKIETLKKYAEIFDITLDELLREDSNNSQIENLNILSILKEQKDMGIKGNLYHNTQIAFSYNTNHIERKHFNRRTNSIYF